MKKISQILIAFISAVLLFLPIQQFSGNNESIQYGKVINILEFPEVTILDFQLPDGSIYQANEPKEHEAFQRNFKIGDQLQLIEFAPGEYYIGDFKRSTSLYFLFALFLVTVVLVAGKQGIGATFGMIFSFLVIFKLILPLILSGFSPVLAALAGITLMVPVNFATSHGFSQKTLIAAVSTILTLIFAALLGAIFTTLSSISGTSTEEVAFLSLNISENINFQGLFLAGLIISILGVLDDITISQASIVNQLSKRIQSRKEIFTSAMAVGRDHIASLVNTLILVYAGASLPLMLLFLDNSQTLGNVINNEFLAEEIIRTLVGSIALVLAVPITTFIALVKKS